MYEAAKWQYAVSRDTMPRIIWLQHACNREIQAIWKHKPGQEIEAHLTAQGIHGPIMAYDEYCVVGWATLEAIESLSDCYPDGEDDEDADEDEAKAAM